MNSKTIMKKVFRYAAAILLSALVVIAVDSVVLFSTSQLALVSLLVGFFGVDPLYKALGKIRGMK